MMEPFVPRPDDGEEIAAADPRRGGPESAPGFGVAGEEPDRPVAPGAADQPEDVDGTEDTPFRRPDVPER